MANPTSSIEPKAFEIEFHKVPEGKFGDSQHVKDIRINGVSVLNLVTRVGIHIATGELTRVSMDFYAPSVEILGSVQSLVDATVTPQFITDVDIQNLLNEHLERRGGRIVYDDPLRDSEP